MTLVAAFRDYLGATTPSDRELERHVPAALEDPATEFCCAWLDARPVGYTQTRFFTSVWVGGTEAHLEDLFVLADARGRAIGRALLLHALRRAERRGARAFGLNTNEYNEAAQRLYRSEGLRPQQTGIWREGREIHWVRSLGPTGGGRGRR